MTRPVSSMPRMRVRTETLDRSDVIFPTVPESRFCVLASVLITVRCTNRLSYAPLEAPGPPICPQSCRRCVEPATGTGGHVRDARPGQVIVVGAGPTGLILAAELALAGVPCLVLERRSGPRADSRAICLHARTMEMLHPRGQASRFTDAGLAVPSFPLGLRGAEIDFSVLDSDFPYLLDMPQSEIEGLLLARAVELGAEIRWSTTVTSVEPDEAGVRVATADGSVAHADYVVACDGVHSFVRNAMAIPFPGIHNPGSVILADLRLDSLPMDSA